MRHILGFSWILECSLLQLFKILWDSFEIPPTPIPLLLCSYSVPISLHRYEASVMNVVMEVRKNEHF